MCVPGLDPITIAALAASAAGTALTGYEQNQTQNAMIGARNSATQAELLRQQDFQRQADATHQATMTKFKPEQQAKDLTTQQATATENYTANTPSAATTTTPTSAGAPRVVQDAAAKSAGDVFRRASNYNAALGNLTGYDQRFFNNNLNLNSSARKLATTSDFARTSAAVNGIEQNAAYRNAFRPNSGMGDLLQFGGNVGAYGAGKGWFNPATKATTPTFNPYMSSGAIY